MTTAAMTAIKMLESLPEDAQERVAEQLRVFIEEERDEAKWHESFSDRKKLQGLADKAKMEIQAGMAVDMDYEKL